MQIFPEIRNFIVIDVQEGGNRLRNGIKTEKDTRGILFLKEFDCFHSITLYSFFYAHSMGMLCYFSIY
jgi:hypothetical protein